LLPTLESHTKDAPLQDLFGCSLTSPLVTRHCFPYRHWPCHIILETQESTKSIQSEKFFNNLGQQHKLQHISQWNLSLQDEEENCKVDLSF
jgi:hypothetical protein